MQLQLASAWKRISAWLFDIILLAVFAVLFAFALSGTLGYNTHSDAMEAAYAKYETQFGVTFDITEEAYLSMSEAEKANYDAAYEALLADEDAMYAYGMLVNLTLLITSLGILLSVAGLEFAVPLLFKNGQTIGRRIFGVALVKPDGVKINALQLTIRVLLGKYTVGIMIPVLVFTMLMFNITGLFGTILVLGIWLAQLLCLMFTKNRTGLADLMAGTVPVDMSTQRIFASTDDRISYQKKLHAEEVSRQEY